MTDERAASASRADDSDGMLSSPVLSASDSEFDEEEIMRVGAVDDADWELARGGTLAILRQTSPSNTIERDKWLPR